MGAAKSAITIGTFDGIHLGHRALLAAARELAASKEIKSIAYTFERPPQNYFGNPKRLLLPPQKKLELLAKFVDQVEVADFPSIQSLAPEDFASQILVKRLGAVNVVVGEDFCFGKNRQGNVAVLQHLGDQLGFEVKVVHPIRINEEPVSSTAIRKALAEGDVERATRFLGERPGLWGHVVHGAGQARELGFPTANLALDPEVLLPAHGIYAVKAHFNENIRPGALYIGDRPTFDGRLTSIEVHVLDEHKLDLYGKEIGVKLYQRVRGDERFESIEALRAKIRADIEAVRDFFEEAKNP